MNDEYKEFHNALNFFKESLTRDLIANYTIIIESNEVFLYL